MSQAFTGAVVAVQRTDSALRLDVHVHAHAGSAIRGPRGFASWDFLRAPGVPAACETRISYGPAWQKAPNHPSSYDDVQGVVTWNGHCAASGGSSIATLSNGWAPYFSGSDARDLAFRHSQCGGLYANPVVDSDCPDPGVTQDGDTYYMACTAGPAYPIRTSKDLVNWNKVGTIFTNANKPSWASGTYWAPEIHKVGTGTSRTSAPRAVAPARSPSELPALQAPPGPSRISASCWSQNQAPEPSTHTTSAPQAASTTSCGSLMATPSARPHRSRSKSWRRMGCRASVAKRPS